MGDREGAVCHIGRVGSGRIAEFGCRAQIIVPIMGSTLEELRDDIRAAATVPHDLIEWRVDGFGQYDPAVISSIATELMRISDVPLLATIRTTDEGGAADLSGDEYAALVAVLATVADAVDVEISRNGAPAIIAEARSAGACVVASFHDFSGPRSADQLIEIYRSMNEAGADILKTAVYCHSDGDVEAIWDAQAWAWLILRRPIIGIGMGRAGQPTRIVGMSRFCAATFASAGTVSAPGQLSAHDARILLDQEECET